MKPRVLFIEDDPEQISLYKTKFELEGFEVSYTHIGTEGVAMAKKNKPDLIFLDILMPDENGLEVLKKLKQDEATKEIPTVLFTNLSDKISREDGIGMGAADYLVKTDVSLKDLVDIARNNLKKK